MFEELLEVMLPLLIVLGVVTLVGHGIWIGLAWLGRLLLSNTAGSSRDETRQCPYCFQRQLGRFDRAGVIDTARAKDLLERADEYRNRLLNPPAPEPVAQAAASVVEPTPPEPPGRGWVEALTGFLEERNIHWGELVGVTVGGLLMVGASIALVISLWDLLGENQIFQFSVFVAYSSVVFAAGAGRCWRSLVARPR